MNELNGILEDIGAEIGWSATIRLVAVFGGKSLFVPASASSSHRIAKVIGIKAFERLVALCGSETVDLPRCAEFDELRRVRTVAGLLSRGITESEVARLMMMSPRHIKNLRAQAEEFELLPMVWKAKPPEASDQPAAVPSAAAQVRCTNQVRPSGGPSTSPRTRERRAAVKK